MQRVLEEQVAEKRLEWCVAALRKHLLRPGGADADGAPPSWEEVLAFARQSLPASWRRSPFRQSAGRFGGSLGATLFFFFQPSEGPEI